MTPMDRTILWVTRMSEETTIVMFADKWCLYVGRHDVKWLEPFLAEEEGAAQTRRSPVPRRELTGNPSLPGRTAD